MTVAARADTPAAARELLAPYVPSPEPLVDRMLALARVGPGDTVYDLGSGDGRIVVAAAQRFGAQAVGVELDDGRYARSAARVRELGLAPRARIVHGDLLGVDLRPATVVTLYQLPSVNAVLRPRLERELRPGARVVTLDFPVDGWKPARVATGRLADGSQHAVFLYGMSDVRKEAATMADGSSVKRSYTSGRLSLELQGVPAGPLVSCEGGDATSEVVTEKLGADRVAHKHLAGVKYEDVTVRFGTGMSSGVYDWITSTLQRKYARQDGALIASDFDLKERSRLEFYHGLITEIGFPACDAASKDAAHLSLKIAPEYTRMAAASGKAAEATSARGAGLSPKDFVLKIDGLTCTKVRAIDALRITQKVAESPAGEDRDYEKEPSALEIPDLAVVFAESAGDGFRAWHEDFVIKGNNGSGSERSGTLQYLAPNLKDVLLTLTFSNLGIYKLATVPAASQTEKLRLVRAVMYCEDIQVKFGPAASSAKGQGATQGASTQGAGTASAPPSAGTSVVVPVDVVPYVPSVVDKLRIAGLPQELAGPARPPVGRPLKFRA